MTGRRESPEPNSELAAEAVSPEVDSVRRGARLWSQSRRRSTSFRTADVAAAVEEAAEALDAAVEALRAREASQRRGLAVAGPEAPGPLERLARSDDWWTHEVARAIRQMIEAHGNIRPLNAGVAASRVARALRAALFSEWISAEQRGTDMARAGAAIRQEQEAQNLARIRKACANVRQGMEHWKTEAALWQGRAEVWKERALRAERDGRSGG